MIALPDAAKRARIEVTLRGKALKQARSEYVEQSERILRSKHPSGRLLPFCTANIS